MITVAPPSPISASPNHDEHGCRGGGDDSTVPLYSCRCVSPEQDDMKEYLSIEQQHPDFAFAIVPSDPAISKPCLASLSSSCTDPVTATAAPVTMFIRRWSSNKSSNNNNNSATNRSNNSILRSQSSNHSRHSKKRVRFPVNDKDLVQTREVDIITDDFERAAVWYTGHELTARYADELRHNYQIQYFYGNNDLGYSLEPHNLTWRGLEDAQLGRDRLSPIHDYVASVLECFADSQENDDVDCVQSSTNQEQKQQGDQFTAALASYASLLSKTGQAMARARGHKDALEARQIYCQDWETTPTTSDQEGQIVELLENDGDDSVLGNFMAWFCV